MSNTIRCTAGLMMAAMFCVIACQPTNDQREMQEELVIRDSMVCYSLFGKPLNYPTETRSSYDRKDSLLSLAKANYDSDSRSLDNIIWYARRLAYLSEYPTAMSVYTRGLHLHPQSPELYRHRGHRYLSMRRFEEAVGDLTLAAEYARSRPIEIEPDGIPNALDQPLSSLQFNIWYHLGLAYYLQGDYELASRAYDSCMVYSTNDDLLCATTEWYYLTARRMGNNEKARQLLEPIKSKMTIIENDAYHKLLLMYKGDVKPEDLIALDTVNIDAHSYSTIGYGVANHLLVNGRDIEAGTVMDLILGTDAWASFGYIATEADRASARW